MCRSIFFITLSLLVPFLMGKRCWNWADPEWQKQGNYPTTGSKNIADNLADDIFDEGKHDPGRHSVDNEEKDSIDLTVGCQIDSHELIPNGEDDFVHEMDSSIEEGKVRILILKGECKQIASVLIDKFRDRDLDAVLVSEKNELHLSRKASMTDEGALALVSNAINTTQIKIPDKPNLGGETDTESLFRHYAKILGIDVHLVRDSLLTMGGTAAALFGTKYLAPRFHMPRGTWGTFSDNWGAFSMEPSGRMNGRFDNAFPLMSQRFKNAISPPVTEEIPMRWLLQHGLFRVLPKTALTLMGLGRYAPIIDNWIVAGARVVTVAGLFGFGHAFWEIWHNYFYQVWAGIILGAQMEYTQNILVSMMTHGLYNYLVSAR